MPMHLLPQQALKNARKRLKEYAFDANIMSLISQRLHDWEHNDAAKRLDLNTPSRFRYFLAIKRAKDLHGEYSAVIAELAVVLIVCYPEFPEVVHYLRKLTNHLDLVTEWASFATSAAWAPYRDDDAASRLTTVLAEDDLTLQSVPEYEHPLLLTENGELRGYTAMTTLQPACCISPIPPLTLRVGWHKPTTAAVLGFIYSTGGRRVHGFKMYCADRTLDERRLGWRKVIKRALKMEEVVFIKDFGCLDILTGFESLMSKISSQGPSEESLGSIISRVAAESKPGTSLQEVATMSDLSYGTGPAFPNEIAEHVYGGRIFTGILKAFRGKIDAFHQGFKHKKMTAGDLAGHAAASSGSAGAAESRLVANASDKTWQVARKWNRRTNSQKQRRTNRPVAEAIDKTHTGATRAELDELFKLAKPFVDKYLAIFPPSNTIAGSSAGVVVISDDEGNDAGSDSGDEDDNENNTPSKPDKPVNPENDDASSVVGGRSEENSSDVSSEEWRLDDNEVELGDDVGFGLPSGEVENSDDAEGDANVDDDESVGADENDDDSPENHIADGAEHVNPGEENDDEHRKKGGLESIVVKVESDLGIGVPIGDVENGEEAENEENVENDENDERVQAGENDDNGHEDRNADGAEHVNEDEENDDEHRRRPRVSKVVLKVESDVVKTESDGGATGVGREEGEGDIPQIRSDLPDFQPPSHPDEAQSHSNRCSLRKRRSQVDCNNDASDRRPRKRSRRARVEPETEDEEDNWTPDQERLVEGYWNP